MIHGSVHDCSNRQTGECDLAAHRESNSFPAECGSAVFDVSAQFHLESADSRVCHVCEPYSASQDNVRVHLKYNLDHCHSIIAAYV